MTAPRTPDAVTPRTPDATVTRSLNASLGAGIAAIAAVAVLTGIVALVTAAQLRHAIVVRDTAAEIARSVADSEIAMLNQETGLRGALLTGEAASLAPYRDGRAAFERIDRHLHAIVVPGSDEAGRLAEAEAAARTWQRVIGEPARQAMADPATRPGALRLEASGEGRRSFDQVRAALEAASDAARARRAGARTSCSGGASCWWGPRSGSGSWSRSPSVRRSHSPSAARSRSRWRRSPVRCGGSRAATSRSPFRASRRAARWVPWRAPSRCSSAGLVELERTSVLRATADTLPALVGYVDAARRIRFLNGEFGRACGLRQDVAALGGRRLAEVFAAGEFPGEDAGELDAAFDGVERRFEHRLLPPGAEEARHYEAIFRPHRGESGVLLGVVTLLTDITERRRLASRLAIQAADLARSNDELEQFAYVASHDLKAPLRGIENLVTWIEEDLGALVEGGVRTNMDLLRSRVRRLDSLLDDLLAYSRAGRTDSTDERVDTGALVAELASLVGPPAGFRIEAAPDMPAIVTPRAPLTQVLQNLIGNAIKHHDHTATGHVWVRAERCESETCFTVEDDGPGVPGQFRERVFGMFQTLRPRDEVEGSGMGLAIVKKLVERRGGTIRLASRDATAGKADAQDAAAGKADAGDAATGNAVPGNAAAGHAGARGLAVHFTWPDRERAHSGASPDMKER